MPRDHEQVRAEILELVGEYATLKFPATGFVGGRDPVHYAGRVFDGKEMQALVDSALEFWLTAGRFAETFESELARFVGVEHALLVNSGSSANLLAVTALTSPLLGERRLKAGDEVITVAAGFPTTVNPILQNGLVPVFVDIEEKTYNVDPARLRAAVGPRTRAICLAHTLGNPLGIDTVLELVREHDLWFVEDCCDALGSTYRGAGVGTFGHVATFSFYPAHHITMGEGGAVVTRDAELARAVHSLRDWGRDCHCGPGESNRCGKRFSGRHGELPAGYDHKYVYSHIGYNLKATDLQAAIGTEQLKKLPGFIARRRENFRAWSRGFSRWEDRFVLPRALDGAEPAWFAFPVSVRADAGFSRTQLTEYLSRHRVETRNLFGGNLLRQPAYAAIPMRVAGPLTVTDFVAEHTFFLGTYPGMTSAKIDYVLDLLGQFCARGSS